MASTPMRAPSTLQLGGTSTPVVSLCKVVIVTGPLYIQGNRGSGGWDHLPRVAQPGGRGEGSWNSNARVGSQA